MLTVRERGGRFQAIVRVKQNGVIVFTESRTFPTRRLAQDWGERLDETVARVGVTARQLSAGTLANLIEKYRSAIEEVKPLGRSMNSDLDMLARELGATPLNALTSHLVVSFARRRREGGAGPATVMHNLATLRGVVNAAQPMFGIDLDARPVESAIKQLVMTGHAAKSASRDRRPSTEELATLRSEFLRIANYPQTKIPMHTIIELAVALPRRIGELCAMRWVDYQAGVVVLRDTKHPRRPRTEQVPVPPDAQRILAALPRMDERILPYKSESVSAAFDRACERLGIADLHLHDLRHEGVCRLFERGLQLQEVAMVSGHLSWQTLKRYTHLSPQHVLERMSASAPRQQESGS